MTNRIDIAPRSGIVGTVGGKDVIGQVNVTVQTNPGAKNVDLRNVTVQWLDPSAVYRITHYSVDAADADFGVTSLKNGDESLPVLNDPDDRFILTFDTGDAPRDVVANTVDGPVDGPVDVEHTDEPLKEGDTVLIKLSTKSGATTQTTVTVPETLSGITALELGRPPPGRGSGGLLSSLVYRFDVREIQVRGDGRRPVE